MTGGTHLESGPLSCASLFLHWHDLHHLIFQRGSQEGFDYLIFLDWQREQVDLLKALDLPLQQEIGLVGQNKYFLIADLRCSYPSGGEAKMWSV